MDESGYASPLVGGDGALIRDWIQSRNFAAGPPVVGWQIAADGTASFGGGVTIAGDLTSANYAAGSAGYKLTYASGSAEINDLTARGQLTVGNPPASGLKLFVDPASSNRATVAMYSGDADETNPGGLIAQPDTGGIGICSLLFSPRDSGGGATLLKLLAGNAGQRPQAEFAANVPDASGQGLLAKVYGDFQTVAAGGATGKATVAGDLTVSGTYQPGGIAQFDSLHSDGDITCDLNIYGNLVEGNTAVQAGLATGLHTYLNVNQLQAYNAGAGSPLYLNWSNGAAVNIGSGGLLVNGVLDPNSIAATVIGGVTCSGGVISTGGSAVGTSFIIGGGQLNAAVSPPTTGSAASATWVNTSGTNWRLYRSTSSRRFKENIRDLDTPIDAILALAPRMFQRNDHRDFEHEDENGQAPFLPVTEDTPWDVGFIAEEAQELGLEEWVQRDSEGQVDGFAYATFVAAQQLVLREQQQLITDLTARVAELERRLSAA